MVVISSETQERARSARKDSAGPRRGGLLTAAANCFNELGYDRTTVETITARAQVSRPTFYAYFSSKDEVFRALAELICTQLLKAQLVEDADAGEPREVIRATTRAFAEAVFANGALLALIEHRAALNPEVGELWSRVRSKTRRRFTVFLQRVNDRGGIDPCVSPSRIVETLADAMLIGATRLASAGADERERFIVDHIVITERLVGFPS